MKLSFLKKYPIFSVSTILTVCTGIVLACAGGDYWEDFTNSFFSPEASGTDNLKPFYRSVHIFYKDYEYTNSLNIMDTSNINEWKSFYSDKINVGDLNYIIYKARIGEIDTSIFYLKNNAFPISPELRKNTLFQFDDKVLIKEFLFYLGFAKRCEPYSTYVPGWWNDYSENDPRKNTAGMQKLIAGGLKAVTAVKSNYIKQRYIFQLVRLYFQSGDYNAAINFFNANKTSFIAKDNLYYRCLGYIAGSYYNTEQFSEANYLYSLIFDNCDLMKETSYLSFHPQEESDWEQSLKLAKTTHEKEVLWLMLGIYNDPLRAMQVIYNLNPKSELVNLLLVRAVNINEESFLDQENWDAKNKGQNFKSDNIDNGLLDFINSVANNGNTIKPALWNLSAGYLNMIKGNFKTAEKYLSKAAKTDEQLINDQVHAFRIICQLEQYDKPDATFEENITKELIWLKEGKTDPDFRGGPINDWVLSTLSNKYYQWGNPVKAICLYENMHPDFYTNEINVNSLQALIDKPKKTKFEQFILKLYPYSKNNLLYFKALNRIFNYKLKEAIAILDSCSKDGFPGLPADPFVIHINDCHDCDFLAFKEDVYDTYTLLKQIVTYEDKAREEPKNASKYYFLIANALYNITYFGNAHDVFSSPMVPVSVGYTYFGWDQNLIADSEKFYDCSKAMEFYQKAMDASKDAEFKAKCCFMAAKCEQNNYFLSTEFTYDRSIKSGVYFKMLFDSYSKTKYYQEVLNECGYFKKYELIRKKK